VLDISTIVNENNDRGILSLTPHPNFPTQPYFYAVVSCHCSSEGPEGAFTQKHNNCYKVHSLHATLAVLDSREQITREPTPSWNDVCVDPNVRNGVPWCQVAVQVRRYQVRRTRLARKCCAVSVSSSLSVCAGLRRLSHLGRQWCAPVVVYGG
jgi:hypothetical protein